MVEVWRRDWGEDPPRPAKTRLARSAPPPPAASRGGINATQMTPEPQIDGGQRGKCDTEQQARIFGERLACRGAELVGAPAGLGRGRGIGHDGLVHKARQG